MNNDNNKRHQPFQYEGAEISMVDLWRVIVKRKMTIFVVFIVILLSIVLKAMITPPIYESSSVIHIGSVGGKFVEPPTLLAERLKEEYQIGDFAENKFDSCHILSATIDKKVGSSIVKISASGLSADGAREYLKIVVSNILSQHKTVYNRMLDSKKNLLASDENNLSEIKTRLLELNPLIEKLKSTNPTHATVILVESIKFLSIRETLEKSISEQKSSIASTQNTQIYRTPTLKPKRIKPNIILYIISGLVLGLFVGIFAAFVQDFVVNSREV